MYLQKISIKNFRIFDNFGVDVLFKKGVNAIIGENNSGKSALIDAIRIAFSVLLYRREIYFNKSDFHINPEGERAVTAQFDVYLEDVPKNLIEIWDPESPTRGEFHLSFYLETTASGNERVRCKSWGGKVEGNPLTSDTFDAINVAFLDALRDSENEMRPSRSSKLANLLSTVTKDETQKVELVEKLQNANSAILKMDPLKRTKEIINNNLLDIEQDLLRQEIDIGLVEPRFESITSSLRSWVVPRWYFINKSFPLYEKLYDDSQNSEYQRLIHISDNGLYIDIKGFLNKNDKLKDNEKNLLLTLMQHSFELSQNGLGYNNLLFMSTVLGDMSLDRNGIYLNLFAVEEPEAHLHPQLQELIHNFFDRKYKNSQSIQVIYTSHSPTLVSKIGIDSTNLLFENNHRIYCHSLANADLEDTDKDYLEKYLDVTKSQIFFAKGIIFVEGISEALLIPEMAKLLKRPLDKYAVEIVNIDGTAFKPFAKILTLPNGKMSFAKAAIITDDDRCTDKNKLDEYITKDIDFDDFNSDELKDKLAKGSASSRLEKIRELCSDKDINVFSALKTFEYELSLKNNNISYILNAIIDEYPIKGKTLKEKLENETDLINKALMIWLFIRARDKCKAQISQSLCRVLQKQVSTVENGDIVEKPFEIPQYISDAIYSVTEPEDN